MRLFDKLKEVGGKLPFGKGGVDLKKGEGRDLVVKPNYPVQLPSPSEQPVADRGISQDAGSPDIFYLWGPGRVLAQRLQAWAAISLFASVAVVGYVGVSADWNLGASRYVNPNAVYSGRVTSPPQREGAQDGLLVEGRPYYPAMERLPEGYEPAEEVQLSPFLRSKAHNASGVDVWDELGAREVSVEEFWKTPIPREGLLARTSFEGVRYALLGTYLADVVPQVGGGERRPWPAVFIHRFDPDAEGRARSILYQVEAPLLAHKISGVKLVSSEMAPDFWAAKGPSQDEE